MRQQESKGRARKLPGWILLSILVHALGLWLLTQLMDVHQKDQAFQSPVTVTYAPELDEAVQEPPRPETLWDGQLVDLAKPEEEQRPEEADYLAEHSRVVPVETRSLDYRINPEVLSPIYSPDDKVQMEDMTDVGADEHSTGAQKGNDRFDPERDGNMAAIPKPFQLHDQAGVQQAARASSSSQQLAGAPNNDLLDEEIGPGVYLNTREFLYAGYINQIRRLVNFYWKQELDNLSKSGKSTLVKPEYETVVEVTLSAQGGLQSLSVGSASGSVHLDRAVLTAFKSAAPFPEPPEGMLTEAGLAPLGTMGFTVTLGRAQLRHAGVDPRGGVQFPGILKAPR